MYKAAGAVELRNGEKNITKKSKKKRGKKR